MTTPGGTSLRGSRKDAPWEPAAESPAEPMRPAGSPHTNPGRGAPPAKSHDAIASGMPASTGPQSSVEPSHQSIPQPSGDGGQPAGSCPCATHLPWTQDVGVHMSRSSQSASKLQQPGTSVPPPHTPDEHFSPTVHGLPSSQPPARFSCEQVPLPGSHRSDVHALWSSHAGTPPPHTPPVSHDSASMQGSPESQPMPGRTGTPVQPDDGSQPSTVQSFRSSQETGWAMQVPPEQAPAPVQASPSSQGAWLAGNEHAPVSASQRSSVQGLSSVHRGVTTQAPPVQIPPVVHESECEHIVPSTACSGTQRPVAGSHSNRSHAPGSGHTTADPGSMTQAAPTHCQRPAHRSSIGGQSPADLHGHTFKPAVQSPPRQTSTVQEFPSMSHGASSRSAE